MKHFLAEYLALIIILAAMAVIAMINPAFAMLTGFGLLFIAAMLILYFLVNLLGVINVWGMKKSKVPLLEFIKTHWRA